MHRLREAYYLDEAGQPQPVSYVQCLQYMFVNYNIVVAIGVFCVVIGLAAGHGSMLNPKPRSAHSQTFDERNQCGASNPYSTAGRFAGEYVNHGNMDP